MRRTLVLGDLHGGFKALKQVLERSDFDYEIDRLISLGDVADGWPDIVECFDELLKIRNLVMVRGNHDQWLLDWMEDGVAPYVWTSQGGQATLDSYKKHSTVSSKKKNKHYNFLKKTPFYHVDDKNRLYVHGGYKQGVKLEDQKPQDLMWDRSLLNLPKEEQIEDFKQVFIGHTSIFRQSDVPIVVGKFVYMDTGGGWEGVLSLMDVDTGEFWQSDTVQDLYPDVHHR